MKDRPNPSELIARGLWIHSGHALLCTNPRGGYAYLPGGHVEPGESIAQALAREFLEETGQAITVGECLLVTENAFVQKGRPRHEVNIVLHVQQSATCPAGGGTPPEVASRESDIGFRWVSRAEMIGLDVRPACIREWLLWRLGCDGRAAGEAPAGFSKVLWTSDLR